MDQGRRIVLTHSKRNLSLCWDDLVLSVWYVYRIITAIDTEPSLELPGFRESILSAPEEMLESDVSVFLYEHDLPCLRVLLYGRLLWADSSVWQDLLAPRFFSNWSKEAERLSSFVRAIYQGIPNQRMTELSNMLKTIQSYFEEIGDSDEPVVIGLVLATKK